MSLIGDPVGQPHKQRLANTTPRVAVRDTAVRVHRFPIVKIQSETAESPHRRDGFVAARCLHFVSERPEKSWRDEGSKRPRNRKWAKTKGYVSTATQVQTNAPTPLSCLDLGLRKIPARTLISHRSSARDRISRNIRCSAFDVTSNGTNPFRKPSPVRR